MSEEAAVLGRVLVVDDDRGLLSIIKGILSKDYDVTLASSGPEALEALADGGADLVLLDIMMPGMDGLEVCRKIKADAATADLPVIFLTGMEDEDAEEDALDAGAADFISKPIRPRILESRVRMQMQNYLYLQFLEKMLSEKSTTVDRLKAETAQLLKSIGLTASR
ncbi:MAG: response regulator [Halieaceae bacterium]|jgi:putative two-component system response regulator|nr:response regulator [Halieaceae bacterium]